MTVSKRSGRSHRRRGFTLTELLGSSLIIFFVMGGMMSAMLLATHALPDEDSPLDAVVSSHDVLDRLSTELYTAQIINTMGTTGIDFWAPDLDGDGSPDRVVYNWSGEVGAPLWRAMNGRPRAVIPSVNDFSLGYMLRRFTTSEELVDEVVSAEQVLCTSDNWAHTGESVDITDETTELNKSAHLAQIFVLPIPRGATHVRISNVRASIRKKDGNKVGTITAKLKGPEVNRDDFSSDDKLLATTSIDDSQLERDVYQWMAMSFGDVEIEVEGKDAVELMLYMEGDSSGRAEVQTMYASNAPTDSFELYWSVDSGFAWGPSAELAYQRDIRMYVSGQYVTRTSEVLEESDAWVLGAHVAITANEQSESRVMTTIPLLNEPEVPGS